MNFYGASLIKDVPINIDMMEKVCNMMAVSHFPIIKDNKDYC